MPEVKDRQLSAIRPGYLRKAPCQRYGYHGNGCRHSAAIGKDTTVSVADSVVLGSDSVSSRVAGATEIYLKKSSDMDSSLVSTHNAIAIGDEGIVTC